MKRKCKHDFTDPHGHPVDGGGCNKCGETWTDIQEEYFDKDRVSSSPKTNRYGRPMMVEKKETLYEKIERKFLMWYYTYPNWIFFKIWWVTVALIIIALVLREIFKK